jgi:hypothetical protein
MEIAIVILSITLFLSIIFLGILFSKYTKLLTNYSDTVSRVKKEKEKLDNLIQIEPGDNAIIPNYGLQYTDDSTGEEVVTSFKITYEVEILEVAKDKLKVKATDFTSIDSIARDPQKKQGILNFLQDKWVDKSSVELVMDAQKRRNIKLNELGI